MHIHSPENMIPKHAHPIDQRVLALESLTNSLAGTAFSRVYMDNCLCRKEEIIPTGHESTLVWCLGIGPISSPKKFFYANTIEEALAKAEKYFEE